MEKSNMSDENFQLRLQEIAESVEFFTACDILII